MRPLRTQIVVVFLASLAAWTAYYLASGEALSQPETLVVVGASALLVLALSKRKRKDTDAPGK